MEVNLSPYRIEFVDPTRTVAFNGLDMLRAETLRPNTPPYNTGPPTNIVRIYLDGEAKQTYGPYYDVNLTPGVITNQPTWIDKRTGAAACLADIAPIIRANITGPFPLVKNSVEYDGGEIQLVGDVPSPGPDMHYATDGAGARGWYPSSTGTVTAVTATAPILSSGGTTPDISHATTAVTPGSYTLTNLTVDAYGHITAASNGSAPTVEDLSLTNSMLLMGG